ncbi:hypothetical protein RB195_003224 [Necator americanus]|uniref:Phlebovirus glycoprotein G2 fusion domain-containing protein n=1 Tax=Necator americanus TaxID=51031 RepID=A0ABR1DMM6_NECAM
MPPTFYSMEIVIVICFATMTDFATSSNTTATNSDSTTMEPTSTASSTGTSSTSSTSSTTMSSVSTTSSTGTSSTSTTSSTKTSPTSTTLSTDTSSMSPTSSTTTSPMSPTSSTTTSMNTTTSTASFSTVLPTVTTLTDTTSSIVMSTGPTLQTISLTSTALFNTTHQISVTTKGWNATAILERSVTNYRDNYDKIELPYVPPLKIEELLNKCVHPKFLLNTTVPPPVPGSTSMFVLRRCMFWNFTSEKDCVERKNRFIGVMLRNETAVVISNVKRHFLPSSEAIKETVEFCNVIRVNVSGQKCLCTERCDYKFEATLDRKYLESCVAKNPTLGRFSSHAIGDEQNLEPESSHMQIFRKVPDTELWDYTYILFGGGGNKSAKPFTSVGIYNSRRLQKIYGISEFALSTIIVLWTILCMKILFELLHVTCVVLLNMEAEEEQEL